MKSVRIQLLSSSSVAVSTSQDFDDNATITAFCKEKREISFILQWNSAAKCTAGEEDSLRYTYFFKAHGTQFVYFACVLQNGDGSACIDMRPEPRCLFEHLWVLLVL